MIRSKLFFMKPKMLIFLIVLCLILGCRTKQKIVSSTKEARTEVERVKLDSLKEQTVKQETKKVSDNKVQEKKEEFSGDIIIKGKSDSLNPLQYHNIVNGDTLQSISIRGNADYIINNHFQKNDNKKAQSGKEESANIIQQTARDLVSKETINDVVSTVKNTTKEINSRGFQAGAWIVWAILGIVLIVATGIYFYFKRK